MPLGRRQLTRIARTAIELGLADRRWGRVALTWLPPVTRARLRRLGQPDPLSLDMCEFVQTDGFVEWLAAAHRAWPAPAFFDALEHLGQPVVEDPHELAVALLGLVDAGPMLRWLVRNRSEAVCLRVADALNHAGIHLAGQDRPADALRASQATVTLCRDLAARSPDQRVRLARMLRNLGHDLRNVARFEAAAEALRESVAWLRAGGAPGDEELRFEMLQALIDLCQPLIAMGRDAEALAANLEAMQIARMPRSCADDTDAMQYSMALNNVAQALIGLARWDEAHEAARAAVALRRDLFALDTYYGPMLGSALISLSQIQCALGDLDDAHDITVEAVALLRTACADAFTQLNLASALTQLAVVLDARGAPDAAVLAARESLTLCQTGACHQPGLFGREQANAAALLTRLLAHRDLSAAVGACRAWVAACRLIGDSDQLAQALIHLDDRLMARGNRAETMEAIDALDEALALDASADASTRADVLQRIGRRHLQLDQSAAAADAFSASLDLLRAEPEPDHGALAEGWRQLSGTLDTLGQTQGAQAAAAQAVEHFQALAIETPDGVPIELAYTLADLAAHLLRSSRLEAAYQACQAACAAYMQRRARGAPTPPFRRAHALALRCVIQKALGDPEAARLSALAAVELVWPIFLQAPELLAEETGRLLDQCFDTSLPDLELAARRREFATLVRRSG